jgi:hypothetical protein
VNCRPLRHTVTSSWVDSALTTADEADRRAGRIRGRQIELPLDYPLPPPPTLKNKGGNLFAACTSPAQPLHPPDRPTPCRPPDTL